MVDSKRTALAALRFAPVKDAMNVPPNVIQPTRRSLNRKNQKHIWKGLLDHAGPSSRCRSYVKVDEPQMDSECDM
jgi:hypothetical protein